MPDPLAEGRPHIVIGGRISAETGEIYRQTATFTGGTWHLPTDMMFLGVRFIGLIMDHHTNTHQHVFQYNPDRGGWVRMGPTIFIP